LTRARNAKGIGRGVVKAAKKQGPKDGEVVFRWFRRVAIGGAFGLGPLMAAYPNVFSWLGSVVKYLF
jgi:hypothetical protein